MICEKCKGTGDMGFTYPTRCNICSGTGIQPGSGTHTIVATHFGWRTTRTLLAMVKALPKDICVYDIITIELHASLHKDTTDAFQCKGTPRRVSFGMGDNNLDVGIKDYYWRNDGDKYIFAAVVVRTY